MKYFLTQLVIIFSITTFLCANTLVTDILPYPSNIKINNNRFIISTDFGISITNNKSEKLSFYATRILRRISGRTGLFFPQDVIDKNSATKNYDCKISFSKSVEAVLGIDESYSLKITNDKIEINAVTDIGAMHALETLYQLVNNDGTNYYFPSLEINDSPRFKWRGLMMDVSRHFMPVDVIKRNIDALAMVKMNVLHLHLSDNQSVRVESFKFPQIQKNCTDGEYFTQAQLKDIVNYAMDRGIRVIPEFDIPWHSTAWFAALPELASKKENYKLERNWGVFDPVFNPAIEETYNFFDAFLGEMTQIFPDEYFHIGGDEGTDKHWNENAQIQEFMKKNNMSSIQELHNYFNLRILKILQKYNKKMIGWDEILQPEMPTDIVIQSWRGQKSLFESAKKGYSGILSNGYYIDLIHSTEYHYLNNPIPDSVKLSPEEEARILGGEATMWAELVTPENVDSRIWPRTAAIAERFWSKSSVNDVNNMYERLEKLSNLLESVGIAHIKNQQMMVRRLCNFGNTDALNVLLNFVEPVKDYSRHSQGVKYTSYSPYTRVVDAALPDVKGAREFRNNVDKYLETNKIEYLTVLIPTLQQLVNNNELLKQTINNSPILKEIEPLSNNLTELSKETLKLLESIINKKEITNKSELNSIIEKCKKPYGQVEIMIVSRIEELLLKLK